MKLTTLLILSIALAFARQSSDEPSTLHPMEQASAALSEGETHKWTYNPGDVTATILVQTRSGSLDPMLEVLDAQDEIIMENNNWAAAFSTDAAVLVEAGQSYTLRVSAAFGEGEYTITALPGDMRLQWLEDFQNSFACKPRFQNPLFLCRAAPRF
jgi:hypothetical protein